MSSKTPPFDILLLTYNRCGQTVRCIESILHYSLPNTRIYVLDNGSSDKTPELLLKLAAKDHRLQVSLHRSNLGVAGGRAWLLQKARSPYVGFMDSDVTVYGSFLPLIYSKLREEKTGVVGKSGHQLQKDWSLLPHKPEYEGACDLLSGYSQFFRNTDRIQKKIAIDEAFNYGGAEDDDFCLQWRVNGYSNYQLQLPFVHEWAGTWNTSLYPAHRQKLKEKWQRYFN